jgi:hypothetical protein
MVVFKSPFVILPSKTYSLAGSTHLKYETLEELSILSETRVILAGNFIR